jgi:hypothetical protein
MKIEWSQHNFHNMIKHTIERRHYIEKIDELASRNVLQSEIWLGESAT